MSDACGDFSTRQVICSRCKRPEIGGTLYASGPYEARPWVGLICGECLKVHDEECVRAVLEQSARDTRRIAEDERAGERIDEETWDVL
jgi:hypothetical protein